MSLEIREILTQAEFEVVINALEKERNKARAIYKKPVQGYGGADELEKKKDWSHKAEELDSIIVKLCQSWD